MVNRERKKRKGINEEIRMEKWKEYFITLLGGVKESVIWGGQRKEAGRGGYGVKR